MVSSEGIEQKLILMRKHTHEQLHFQAIKNLTDAEFQNKYNISRRELMLSQEKKPRRYLQM